MHTLATFKAWSKWCKFMIKPNTNVLSALSSQYNNIIILLFIKINTNALSVLLMQTFQN